MFEQLAQRQSTETCDLQYIWIISLNGLVTIKPFEYAMNSIVKSYMYLCHKFEHLHEQSHSNMPPIQFSNHICICIPSLNTFSYLYMLSPDTCSNNLVKITLFKHAAISNPLQISVLPLQLYIFITHV